MPGEMIVWVVAEAHTQQVDWRMVIAPHGHKKIAIIPNYRAGGRRANAAMIHEIT